MRCSDITKGILVYEESMKRAPICFVLAQRENSAYEGTMHKKEQAHSSLYSDPCASVRMREAFIVNTVRNSPLSSSYLTSEFKALVFSSYLLLHVVSHVMQMHFFSARPRFGAISVGYCYWISL
jgi:hypothetical protein